MISETITISEDALRRRAVLDNHTAKLHVRRAYL